LNQHLKDFPFGINGSPKIHLLAFDPDEHLVQVIAAVRLGTPGSQPACAYRSEGENRASIVF
jgi:hypothetical protein